MASNAGSEIVRVYMSSILLCTVVWTVNCQQLGDVRLVDGPSSREGRLEVFDGSEWGTVCDDNFQKAEAQVVCRQLGLDYHYAEALSSALYGEGTGQIVYDDVSCQGNEERLANCTHTTLHNCGHHEDVGVRCVQSTTDFPASQRPYIPVRLVGGPSDRQGRVEVFYDYQWGTVCDDGWSVVDAKVVCRQLGYDTMHAAAVNGAYYGRGRGRIILDEVRCSGWESSLSECSSNDIYVNDCSHSEDAGVKCESKDYTTGRVVGTLVFVGVSSLIIIVIGSVAVACTVKKNRGSIRPSAIAAPGTAPVSPYQALEESSSIEPSPANNESSSA